MEDTVLPTPPASPSTGPRLARSESELVRAIDGLLERYLHLLDEQQTLQEALGRQFASGFFSLARANNSCPPGRRYGEDYYDERMKATRQVEIAMADSVRQDTASPSFSIKTVEPGSTAQEDGNGSKNDASEVEGATSEETKAKTKSRSSNPLHWFGILVPPPLRNAQETFSGAVAGPIAALARVVSEMREVEQKVEGLREQLGGENDTSV